MKNYVHAFTVLTLSCLATEAEAQVNVPRNVEAGNIEEQLPSPKPDAAYDVGERQYKPLPVPEGAEDVRFVLKDIIINGNKMFPDSELNFYDSLLDTEVTLADIYEVADRIRHKYHSQGYILTQAILPEQDIVDGIVTIQVVEGYIAELRWEGEVPENKYVRAMAEEITGNTLFDSKLLESRMLLLNEVPGVQATAALEPLPVEDAPEGAAGIVLEMEPKTFNGSVTIDNYASRYLGVWQALGTVEVYDLLTGADSLQLTGSSSYDPSRLAYGALKYTTLAHESGSQIGFEGTLSYTHPGYSLKPLDIVSRAKTASVFFSQPVLRSYEESLTLKTQFKVRNQYTDVLRQRFSEDRLRTVEVSGTYSTIDRWLGTNLINLAITKGLNIFNATETGTANLSRAGGRSNFTRLNLYANHLQPLDDNFSFIWSFSGQMANAKLLSSEQFSFGGQSFGRGYDPSEISGDEGISTSLELRWQDATEYGTFQPFAFYDLGKVWDKEYNSAITSAASAGIGTRLIEDAYRLEALVAWPLTLKTATPKLGAVRNNPRVGVSITYNF